MTPEMLSATLIPLVVGLVEVCKRAGMPNRFAPLLAVTLGLVIAGATQTRPDLARWLIQGLALGLAACGLYSGSKAVRYG